MSKQSENSLSRALALPPNQDLQYAQHGSLDWFISHVPLIEKWGSLCPFSAITTYSSVE
jgi:hypothetical protein